MRLITFQAKDGPRIAAQRDDALVDLCGTDPKLPRSMKGLLAQGESAFSRAARAAEQGEPLAESDMRRMAPIPHPGKIICVGLNYADHARETGVEPPSEPVIFNKFPSTIRADGDPIRLPNCSDQVDYEAELVAVIGKRGRDIPRETALQHVAGYCCGCDVSARDWQKGKPGRQWLLGKSFDSFAPLGPALVTADEIPDPAALDIRLRLNGQVMQNSNTSELIFPVDYLVAYLSQVCTLEPGDVIFTGTPPGVGMARTPPVFLSNGDVVEVEIQHIGVLRNPVVADN